MTRYILIILFLYSCTQKPKHLDPSGWYERTKALILSQSNLPTDSTSTEKYEDGRNHKIKAFNNGHPTVEKWYRETGEQVVQKNYSRNGQFELREEICKDGKPGFEGIFYKGEAYGLSTWWRCGKSKEEEGIRYKDEKIGVWKNWDDNGKVTETDYKKSDLIDSLQLITRIDE
ncbi:MAG TPA: hypothetical protein VGM30_17085 [Puia sp.]|jgi:antitoxin component YwqK of YwqJK toxin-antitoxin module